VRSDGEQLREVLANTEWKVLHPHAFRYLVATRLDAAGLSARKIADYLGHEKVSMTGRLHVTQERRNAQEQRN
jgi:integrase